MKIANVDMQACEKTWPMGFKYGGGRGGRREGKMPVGITAKKSH